MKTQEKEIELFVCFNCNNKSESDEMKTDIDGEKICQECYEKDYFICNCCDEIVNDDDGMSTLNDGRVCQSCYDENYFFCDGCENDLHNDEYCGNGLCNECYDEDNGEDNGDRWDRKYITSNKYVEKGKRAFSTEIECNYEDSSTMDTIYEDMNQDFGCSGDGSLGNKGIEFQTPKLSGKKGSEELKTFCKLLNDNNYDVDSKCGLHIHLDTSDYMNIPKDYETTIEKYKKDRETEYAKIDIYSYYSTLSDEQYQEQKTYTQKMNKIKNLMKFYLAFESVILSYLPKSRRQNRFCFPLSEFYHEKEISNIQYLEQFETMWYREQDKERLESRKKNKYDESRYAGINFHSMLANSHIEVRYHSGTINYDKIQNWIDLHSIILDRIYNNEIDLEQLTNIKYLLQVSEKQKAMFEMLKLPTDVENYFKQRYDLFFGNGEDNK